VHDPSEGENIDRTLDATANCYLLIAGFR